MIFSEQVETREYKTYITQLRLVAHMDMDMDEDVRLFSVILLATGKHASCLPMLYIQ